MIYIKNVFVLGLVYNTRVDVPLFGRIRVLNLDFCSKKVLSILIKERSGLILYI